MPSYITLLHLMTRTTSGEATGEFPGKINTSNSYFTRKISLCERKNIFVLSPSRHTKSQALSFTDLSGDGTRMVRRPPRSSVRSMKTLSDQTDGFYQMASFSEEDKSCLKKYWKYTQTSALSLYLAHLFINCISSILRSFLARIPL